MVFVAGIDFGTLSVRVSIMDSKKGKLGSASAEYPLLRKREDPDHATQKHEDQLHALVKATRGALKSAERFGQSNRSRCPRHHWFQRASGWGGPAAHQ